MGEVVNPSDIHPSVSDGKTGHEDPVNSEEARQAAPAELENTRNASDLQTSTEPHMKENKWKLAFRQLMFMKRMNMQFNDRTKNEIELRQQNISPTSLICSVPYFNTFSAEEINALVAVSRRVCLRPGETLSLGIVNANLQQEGDFCVVISGNLALSKASVPSAMALKQAALYPQLRLGIGDYFSIHGSSDMKVIAMELAEYLTIPMKLRTYRRREERLGSRGKRGHFSNITPENELDHTLEYLKNALTSIFSARKVRIYALDNVNEKLVIKFSDERLSKRSVDVTSSTGQQVLEKGEPICIGDAAELLSDEIDEDDVARELYRPDTIVLAAPFFEFDAMQTNGGLMETAKIVGVLELVIEPSDHEGDVGSATSNDFCILEFVTEEIGRYLFFHYERFFYVSSQAHAPHLRSQQQLTQPPKGWQHGDHLGMFRLVSSVVCLFEHFLEEKSIAFRASIFFKGDSSERKLGAREIPSLENIPMDKQKLLQRLRRDPLADLSSDDRAFIWTSRLMLMEDSALLPAFLLSVDWGNREQALKNERYHDSALARFLLMRALTNPSQIGYLLYWFLKAESHNQQTAERFNLISSQYLQLCGNYKLEIRQSVYVMRKLEEVAAIVKGESSSTSRKDKLHKALEAVVFPETFQLPLQPRSYCTRVIVENCRVMESKKRPLFLQFESAKAQHGRPYVIFKAGDDLRQDQLVLQILRVMDDLWREAGLDLCLLPYACISTGDEIGMIEVVGDSETLASIIYARHAKSRTKLGRKLNAAKDALIKDGVLSDWLFKQPSSPIRATSADVVLDSVSPTGSAPSSPAKEEERARSISSCFPISPRRRKKSTSTRDLETTQNFVRSCAGYCVATYVLGIGDRHNDNIMLQRSGKFFHIDFGHFLGNFKSKLGVKRERAPFVFTPSMLDTMGGKKSENYQQFQQLACEAFQVLRTNSNLLITLLVLALTCGIPELHSANCIKWVHKTLMLDLPDDEACEAFKKLIHVALHTTTTKLNDAVHLMAH
ncbi:GAF domain-like [Phytophthora cactorum]|nr:GAF domain-like [Phytophthora cactorum]